MGINIPGKYNVCHKIVGKIAFGKAKVSVKELSF
jgi:hypothetical protein